jgi:Uma2 family endonuclease
MATTAAHISVEEYLRGDFEVDCDYVDGVLEERNLGEWDHAAWQKALMLYFLSKESEWGIRVMVELRVQTAEKNYRVPDVCLLRRDMPAGSIVKTPPLAIFEILSPEDRMMRVLGRLADFDRMGVGAIWVIDPATKNYYRYASGQLASASLFVLPGTNYQVAMTEIAALID